MDASSSALPSCGSGEFGSSSCGGMHRGLWPPTFQRVLQPQSALLLLYLFRRLSLVFPCALLCATALSALPGLTPPPRSVFLRRNASWAVATNFPAGAAAAVSTPPPPSPQARLSRLSAARASVSLLRSSASLVSFRFRARSKGLPQPKGSQLSSARDDERGTTLKRLLQRCTCSAPR